MSIVRRVYVSMPADDWLSRAQNALKWGVVDRIERLGYAAEVFTDPRHRRSGGAGTSISGGQSWSAEAAESVALRCHGAAVIGLPRWQFESTTGTVMLPSEFCHYEGALARTVGLPLLVLAQQSLVRRVVFDPSFGSFIGVFPDTANGSWLSTRAFRTAFMHWESELKKRRDVFLGYCGASAGIADALRSYLERTLRVTVLDWRRDFEPGRSILEEIEEARVRCTAGIFLFTKDDELRGSRRTSQAVPRDNVVFETGYFASAKGKSRVLVVRESGTKLPADLGGDIYAVLEDRTQLTDVKKTLRRFVAGL